MYKIKLNAGAWQKCLGPGLLNEWNLLLLSNKEQKVYVSKYIFLNPFDIKNIQNRSQQLSERVNHETDV